MCSEVAVHIKDVSAIHYSTRQPEGKKLDDELAIKYKKGSPL
jgi:hypothetical protein